MLIQSATKKYEVSIHSRLDPVKDMAVDEKTFVVIDKQVYELYCGQLFQNIPQDRLYLLEATEVNKVLDTVRSVNEQASRRVTTGLLNDILTDAQTALQPPATSGRRLRIYYGTQQATKPPTFVLFVNDKELLHFSYERYLENQFRKAFGFDGTPIRFVLREREQKEE